ncbi:hypothetical protein DA803_02105 [[Mycoplasma] phocae]|uniref:Type I restriction modification DNA specificity domain-containing protein n=1 Tax=[Mycoplasma] phocae TaxID=142651 RepID=A0A2Z5IQS4_9BACT|nr:restriction endonuclease subunit S [[Mycoplasma] phocae]AXE60874.1 hypothetical protein DA803_02105 [[Mycoplasma] phocae]
MSKNDKNTPIIRFKGFSDAWEQKKVAQKTKIYNGLVYSLDEINKNGIRVLRSSNIVNGKFKKFANDIFVKKNYFNVEKVEDGDILITSANGSSNLVGKHCIIYNIENENMVHGGFMLLMKSNFPHFMNSYLDSQWYKKFINSNVMGGNGAIGNLKKIDLENYYTFFTSTSEENKINEYYKYFDNLISLHQRK